MYICCSFFIIFTMAYHWFFLNRCWFAGVCLCGFYTCVVIFRWCYVFSFYKILHNWSLWNYFIWYELFSLIVKYINLIINFEIGIWYFILLMFKKKKKNSTPLQSLNKTVMKILLTLKKKYFFHIESSECAVKFHSSKNVYWCL